MATTNKNIRELIVFPGVCEECTFGPTCDECEEGSCSDDCWCDNCRWGDLRRKADEHFGGN
jgi:hypothetical protein